MPVPVAQITRRQRAERSWTHIAVVSSASGAACADRAAEIMLVMRPRRCRLGRSARTVRRRIAAIPSHHPDAAGPARVRIANGAARNNCSSSAALARKAVAARDVNAPGIARLAGVIRSGSGN